MPILWLILPSALFAPSLRYVLLVGAAFIGVSAAMHMAAESNLSASPEQNTPSGIQPTLPHYCGSQANLSIQGKIVFRPESINLERKHLDVVLSEKADLDLDCIDASAETPRGSSKTSPVDASTKIIDVPSTYHAELDSGGARSVTGSKDGTHFPWGRAKNGISSIVTVFGESTGKFVRHARL